MSGLPHPLVPIDAGPTPRCLDFLFFTFFYHGQGRQAKAVVMIALVIGKGSQVHIRQYSETFAVRVNKNADSSRYRLYSDGASSCYNPISKYLDSYPQRDPLLLQSINRPQSII
jgi:hypothetical protein